jgi:predicted CoA-binding protein
MFRNPPPERLRSLLAGVRSIAVVGFSPQPDRPSHRVAAGLQQAGYRIIPVRPGIASGLGEPAFARLSDVPGGASAIDLVDVFRAADQVMPVIDECIELGIRAVWLQDGVVNETAALRAQAAGIEVVMDDCTWRVWNQLRVGRVGPSHAPAGAAGEAGA